MPANSFREGPVDAVTDSGTPVWEVPEDQDVASWVSSFLLIRRGKTYRLADEIGADEGQSVAAAALAEAAQELIDEVMARVQPDGRSTGSA